MKSPAQNKPKQESSVEQVYTQFIVSVRLKIDKIVNWKKEVFSLTSTLHITLVSRVINKARESLLSNQIFLNLEYRVS